MREVSTTEFTRNFGLYREVVQREPVAVTSHGRATGYFVSAIEYDDLQRYKKLVRQSFATTDLTLKEIGALAGGRMSSEHDHLNALLDDE